MAEIIVDLNKIETDDELLVRLYPAKGEKGEQGSQGAKGDKGETGDSGGSAVVVDTVADMIDTTQAYLYVGNESGYTKGDWYYYDGTEWVSGGQYGADGGINTNARNILKYILERVAYTEQGMQTYVDALYQALAQGGGGGGTTTYMIMNALTHVTNSNDATGADEGDSYTATLTADEGYNLGTVTVTMDNVDITSTVYSNGTITIASVTGDVIITAVATSTPVGWYYPFNNSLLSASTKDFGFTGTENYTTGVNGNAYLHEVTTEGTSSTDTGVIKAIGLTDIPDFSGDFTISCWHKALQTNKRGKMIALEKYIGSTSMTQWSENATNVASGWSVAKDTASAKYKGVSIGWVSYLLYIRLFSATNNYACVYKVTPPSGFDSTQWHHYALTRSGSTIYFFVDGTIIFTLENTASLYVADQVAVCEWFKETSADATVTNPQGFNEAIDDLYIAEFCKWSSAFDPTQITY